MQKNLYKTLSYKLKHNHNVGEFLGSYRLLLQKAIDIIWDNTEWVKKNAEKLLSN